jgi:hypothetical protein
MPGQGEAALDFIPRQIPSFDLSAISLVGLRHPVAAPNVSGNWGDKIAARSVEIDAAYPTPDE